MTTSRRSGRRSAAGRQQRQRQIGVPGGARGTRRAPPPTRPRSSGSESSRRSQEALGDEAQAGARAGHVLEAHRVAHRLARAARPSRRRRGRARGGRAGAGAAAPAPRPARPAPPPAAPAARGWSCRRPGGASTTSDVPVRRRPTISGSRSSMGSGASRRRLVAGAFTGRSGRPGRARARSRSCRPGAGELRLGQGLAPPLRLDHAVVDQVDVEALGGAAVR